MSTFSRSQIEDLRDLQRAARELGAEAVIIGAMAYRLFFADEDRHTYDVDLAIALDLDDFIRLGRALEAFGWKPHKIQEQRWMTPHENPFDLVAPATIMLTDHVQHAYSKMSKSQTKRAEKSRI